MSTVQEFSRPGLPPPDNPWLYGWRFLGRKMADGRIVQERVPLTLEDALHPREGDVIPESDLHQMLRAYLADVFRSRLGPDPSILVLSDTIIYWHHPDFENHSPDVAVIFGIQNRKEVYPSFDVVEDGVIPRLVLEIVSPSTRENDVDRKWEEYHQVAVPFYVILDRKNYEDDWKLVGYQYTPRKYLPLPTDERGRLWLEPVQLWLGVEGKKVMLFDGKTDQEIGDYSQLTQSLEEQKALIELEKSRADQEKTRAEQEKMRADQEEKTRREMEARLKEMGAELARLRHEGTD